VSQVVLALVLRLSEPFVPTARVIRFCEFLGSRLVGSNVVSWQLVCSQAQQASSVS
jgi:hypothetical protein